MHFVFFNIYIKEVILMDWLLDTFKPRRSNKYWTLIGKQNLLKLEDMFVHVNVCMYVCMWGGEIDLLNWFHTVFGVNFGSKVTAAY